jgi:hypothetical protein
MEQAEGKQKWNVTQNGALHKMAVTRYVVKF